MHCLHAATACSSAAPACSQLQLDPMYRWHDQVPVGYIARDDELAATVSGNLQEPSYFCSVGIVVSGLFPQKDSLGTAIWDMGMATSGLVWGSIRSLEVGICGRRGISSRSSKDGAIPLSRPGRSQTTSAVGYAQ